MSGHPNERRKKALAASGSGKRQHAWVLPISDHCSGLQSARHSAERLALDPIDGETPDTRRLLPGNFFEGLVLERRFRTGHRPSLLNEIGPQVLAFRMVRAIDIADRIDTAVTIAALFQAVHEALILNWSAMVARDPQTGGEKKVRQC